MRFCPKIIKNISEQIIKYGEKPNLKIQNQKELIKNLNKQLDDITVKNILKDKSKNIIKEEEIKNIKVRFQKVKDLNPKDLRKLVDSGKKEINEGIIITFAVKEGKIGLAVGITNNLSKK